MCVCIGSDAGGTAHGGTAQVEFFGFSGARWKTKKLPVAVPPHRGITLLAVVSFGGTATFVVCCSVACIDAWVHARAKISGYHLKIPGYHLKMIRVLREETHARRKASAR